ncbi:hypothetical protein E9228_002782 [Curtobacterium flaccumfaciens]|uniref:Uncharacterized protein n=1 Tax=Curtobacterium salicis TaxID=1779862 RepID=A0ABX0TE25_9MICO|nr:hypothetical protein [Curtobacterium sp. WW7]
MTAGAPVAPGYPDPLQAGVPTRLPVPRFPDPDCAHRTRVNSRTSLEPIGYDGEGAPLYAWQVDDER